MIPDYLKPNESYTLPAWLDWRLDLKPSKYGISFDIYRPDEIQDIIQEKEWAPFMFPVQSKLKLQKELEDSMVAVLLKHRFAAFKLAYDMNNGNKLVSLANEALVLLNVREKTNKNDGTFVEWIQKIYYGVRGYAWCMYQQLVCVAFAERCTGIVSKIYPSGACVEVADNSPTSMSVAPDNSNEGDIYIVRYFPEGNHHTMNFTSWLNFKKSARFREGNTTAGKVGDKIIREGGGSYNTEREVFFTKNTPPQWVLRIIRPF